MTGWPHPLTPVNDRALVRLIPASYHKPPILRGLTDTDAEADILAELDAMTNARLMAETKGTPAIDRRELAFARRAADLAVYGQTHINAAFTYTRPTGNRFNDGTRGAWYCAYDTATSAEEVAFHKTRELSYIGVFDDSTRYVELLADVIGDFPDLRHSRDHPALASDPATGYPAGQSLALDLRRQGHRALLYPSVRKPGGLCLVAFDPGLIQNVRPGAQWIISWSGSPEYAIHAA